MEFAPLVLLRRRGAIRRRFLLAESQQERKQANSARRRFAHEPEGRKAVVISRAWTSLLPLPPSRRIVRCCFLFCFT